MNMAATASDFASGKDHRDENFPVASIFVRPDCRAPVMAFYRFARLSDDVADHPDASPQEKLARLDALQDTIRGHCDSEPSALALRQVMQARGVTPAHALDLLEAFRRDVTKTRYANLGELMDYCRYSAMPVGRYVLDVHGESRDLWPANDALCAALQIINHLQDCGKDYRGLDRVYLPLDAMDRAGARVQDLGSDRASPALRSVIGELASEADMLLQRSHAFSGGIRDRRLAIEVAVIQRLAESLVARLKRRDPLAGRVRHRRSETLFLASGAALRRLAGL